MIGHRHNLLSVVLVLLRLIQAECQDANCDKEQYATPGEEYVISNPKYSEYDYGKVECRWRLYCPDGYHCRLDCPNINIPQSPSCSKDQFLVALNGDPQFYSAKRYCGNVTLTGVVSTGQTLSVGLATVPGSPGWRFMCSLTAERNVNKDEK